MNENRYYGVRVEGAKYGVGFGSALAIAISVGIAGVSCSGGVATPAAAPSDLPNERPPAAADARPSVLFIGDAYTEGTSSA